jgi:cyclopropane fatty-acyl-phospholipid synthase-like methyltransferase
LVRLATLNAGVTVLAVGAALGWTILVPAGAVVAVGAVTVSLGLLADAMRR